MMNISSDFKRSMARQRRARDRAFLRKYGIDGRMPIPICEKANPAAGLAVQIGGSDVQAHQFDTAAHLRVFMADVWAYTCIRAIGEWVAQIPLLCQRHRTVKGETDWITEESGRAVDLIRHPNHEYSTYHLLNRWTTSLHAVGDSYLIYVKADNELWHVNSDWVKIVVNRAHEISGYEISDRGQSYMAEDKEIIHARLSNPTGEFYGMPPSQTIRNTISTRIYLGEYLKRYFLNDALLGTIYSTDQVLHPETKERIRHELETTFGGYRNAFRVPVLEQGVKLERLAINLKDLVPVDLYRQMREEVLAAYGVPHVMVGVLDDASYANASIQKKLFAEGRGSTTLRLLEDALNFTLAPQFGTDYRFWFDRNKIPALQEETAAVFQRAGDAYQRYRLITKNEAREMIGFDPDPDGDEYFSGPEGGMFNLSVGTSSPAIFHKHELKLTHDNTNRDHAYQHYSTVKRYEWSFGRLIAEFFKTQLERVLKNLESGTSGGRYLSRLYGLQYKQTSDWIFQFDIEDQAIIAATKPTVEKIVGRAGQQSISQIQIGPRFDINVPEVHEMLLSFENRIKKVNQATYDEIKKILGDAYEEGVGTDEIRRRIQDRFAQFSRTRSMLIARTEMNGVVNGGHWLGHKQVGVTHKVWLPSYVNTRDSHLAAGDLPPIPIDEPFPVGGSLMMYPGDPGGPAEEVCNCQCSYEGVFVEEEASFIPDNGNRHRLITTDFSVTR